jgi:hypothetical protein
MRTIKALAKELAKREGKKKQVDIAQLTEVLGHLSDMVYEDCKAMDILFNNGEKRAKKKSKVKRTK